jgi:hypothetical protein
LWLGPAPQAGYSAGSNTRRYRYISSRRPAPATHSIARSPKPARKPRRRPRPPLRTRPGSCAPKVPPRPPDRPSAAGQSHEEGVSRPVGRVLCARLRGPTVIHLGLPLPAASCGLPASIGRAALERSRRPAHFARGPFDLAPGGVYRAAAVTCGAGGLLHHRFTLTPLPAKSGEAVCFLWHCPAGHPGSVLPTTLPCGARTFLTGHEARRDRPADSPVPRIFPNNAPVAPVMPGP